MEIPIRDPELREMLNESKVLGGEFKDKSLIEISDSVLSWKEKFDAKV